MAFSLILLLFTLAWYFWRNYSAYFTLPCYCWFADFQMILTFLRGKKPGKVSLDAFMFNKAIEISNKYKAEGMHVMWLPEPALVIYSPETIKFFSNEPSLTDRPEYYKFFDTFMKNGPLSIGRKKMKEKKKFISPAFYPSMMKNFMTTMTQHAESFVLELRYLENGTTDDLHEIIETRMLKLFMESSLGMKPDSTESNNRMAKFIKLMTKLNSYVIRRLVRPWLHMDFMLNFFSSGRKHLKMAKELNFIAMQILEDMKNSYCCRIQTMNSTKTDKCLHEISNKTFGDVLIEQHLKNPSYSLNDVKTDLTLLILAGYDTISISLTWSLWLLGLHQDVQEKAYREIKTVTDEAIQYEDIRNLTYLENIIKESLRLYPTVPLYARRSDKDLHFGKHTIPRGTTVAFFSYLLHHNSDVYLEPESFNPDRFGEKDSNIKPWALVPFAEGARSCIGKNYAMLAMKIFLVQILRTFKIVSLTRKEDIEFSWEVMLKSKTPIYVKFIPRQLS